MISTIGASTRIENAVPTDAEIEWKAPPWYSTRTAEPILPTEVLHCIDLGEPLPELLGNCPYCISIRGSIAWVNIVPADESVPVGGLGRFYQFTEHYPEVTLCNG